MSTWKIGGVVVAGVILGLGCGDSGSDSDGGGADGSGAGSGNGSSGAGSSEYSCCINGEGYDCPNKAAFDKCAGFDLGACNAACGASDPMCFQNCAMQAANATHDPSDCNPDANAPACNNNTSSSGSGSCTPQAIGCDSTFECCEGLTCKMDPMSGTMATYCLD